MAGGDRHLAISSVYAEALLSLAVERGEEDAVLEALAGLGAAADAEPDFARFLDSPLVDDVEKERFLEELLRGKAPDVLVDGLHVARRKGRLGLLAAIARAYRSAWLAKKGRIEVEVTSAVALDDRWRAALTRAIAERTGREPVLRERVRPEILGGLVVRMADEKFDGSVRRELEVIEGNLLARASLEILSGKEYAVE